jgi:hypothetical protein
MALPRLSSDLYGPPLVGIQLTLNTGLVRTAWMAGTVRSRRKYAHMPTIASCRWQMRAGLLKGFKDWINANGYDWFEMQMESQRYRPPPGTTSTHALAWHTVRVIGGVSVSNVGPFLYEVSADVELKTAVVPVP